MLECRSDAQWPPYSDRDVLTLSLVKQSITTLALQQRIIVLRSSAATAAVVVAGVAGAVVVVMVVVVVVVVVLLVLVLLLVVLVMVVVVLLMLLVLLYIGQCDRFSETVLWRLQREFYEKNEVSCCLCTATRSPQRRTAVNAV